MPAAISFRTSTAISADLSDSEFLQSLAWDTSAPRDLAAAAKAGNVVKFGQLWRQHLRQRRQGSPPKTLLSLWSRNEGNDPAIERAINTLRPVSTGRTRSHKPAIKRQPSLAIRAQGLIKALTNPERLPAGSAFESRLALELLWVLGDKIPQRFWWPLWRQSLTSELALTRTPVPYHEATHETNATVGEWQLLASLVFADIKGAAAVRRQATKQLGQSLTIPTDSDGTPHAELLPRFAFWLAPLLRSTCWSQQAGHSLFDPDESQLLSDVAEKAVALCRPNGQLALMNSADGNALPLLQLAAELFRWTPLNPARVALQSLQPTSSRASKKTTATISVMPSNQSDWARLAVLRSDWSASSATVTIAHHQPLPQLDVTLAGAPLLHGDWGLDVRMGSTALELADEWSCVCWESEPEADFAELQMEGPGKLRLERLVLLSRKDQFLLLADAISGIPRGPVALRSRLPLAAGVNVTWTPGQRDAQLVQASTRARLLPLGLPCDVVHSTPHHCEVREHGLVLEQQAFGQGLFAPLLIDFHPARKKHPLEWKKLTVSEAGQVVPEDYAAAYRWRIGKEQWLLYRSLKPAKVPRAVLGYHTANGFVAGRFDKQGDVDSIVMVEE